MRIQIFVADGTAEEIYTQLGDIMTAVAALPAGTPVSVVAEPKVTVNSSRTWTTPIGGTLYNQADDTLLLKSKTNHGYTPTPDPY